MNFLDLIRVEDVNTWTNFRRIKAWIEGRDSIAAEEAEDGRIVNDSGSALAQGAVCGIDSSGAVVLASAGSELAGPLFYTKEFVPAGATFLPCMSGAPRLLMEGTPAVGSVVYVSETTAGRVSATAPATSGKYVFMVGRTKTEVGDDERAQVVWLPAPWMPRVIE